MSQSVTSALTAARERTAGPGSDWQSATLTDLTSLATHDLDVPSLSMTATTSEGTDFVWEVSDQAPVDELHVGETIWIRQGNARSESVSADSSRWDTTGQWVLESSAARQRRQSLVHRWGRGLAATVLFADLTLGLWRVILQVTLLLVLVIVVEPAWAIGLAGLVILACEEVVLKAVQ
jgi:hypothetical protein